MIYISSFMEDTEDLHFTWENGTFESEVDELPDLMTGVLARYEGSRSNLLSAFDGSFWGVATRQPVSRFTRNPSQPLQLFGRLAR